MVNLDKTTLAVFIVMFWFILPFPMMIMEMGNFESFGIDDFDSIETPSSLLDYIGIAFDLLGMYFWILIIGIPSAPIWVNIIVVGLKLISGLVVYLLLKE